MKTVSWQFVAFILLLACTLALSRVSDRRRPEALAQPLAGIASGIAGWEAAGDAELPPGTLNALAPTSYLVRAYRKGGMQMELFIAFYAQQRAGENMHSPKHCLPGSGWEIWQYRTVAVPVAGQGEVKVNLDSIQKSGERGLVLYWYQSRQRVIASEYLGKVLLARDALVDGRTAGAIVRITAPDLPGVADEAVRFAAALLPQVRRCFGR